MSGTFHLARRRGSATHDGKKSMAPKILGLGVAQQKKKILWGSDTSCWEFSEPPTMLGFTLCRNAYEILGHDYITVLFIRNLQMSDQPVDAMCDVA